MFILDTVTRWLDTVEEWTDPVMINDTNECISAVISRWNINSEKETNSRKVVVQFAVQ